LGLGAWIRFAGNGIDFDHILGSRFRFGWTSGFGTLASTQPMVLGVNLVALIVILAMALVIGRARADSPAGDS
jgi:hypothetical protein